MMHAVTAPLPSCVARPPQYPPPPPRAWRAPPFESPLMNKPLCTPASRLARTLSPARARTLPRTLPWTLPRTLPRTLPPPLALAALLCGALVATLAAAPASAQAPAWPAKPGMLRALAITSARRSPLLPDVPTMEEAGVKGFAVYSWQAFAAPKGLPADVKARLHDALVAGLNDPQVKPKLLELGFEIVGNTPEQFAAFQASEFARWKKVIEVGKITAD